MPKNTGFKMEDDSDNPLPNSPLPIPSKDNEEGKIPPLQKIPDAIAEKLDELQNRAYKEMPEGGASVPTQKLKSDLPQSELPMPANANTLFENLGSVVDTLRTVLDPLKSLPGSLKLPEIPMLFMKDGTNVSPTDVKLVLNQEDNNPKTSKRSL